MPLPTPGDVHVSRPLTNIAIAFAQDPENFLGAKVFPIVKVDKQSDKYYVWDRADFHRDEAKAVGPTGEAPIGQLRISTDSYDCVENKFAHLVDDSTLANQDNPLNVKRTKTQDVVRKLMIRREKDWVTKFFAAGKWTGSSTGADLVGGTDFTLWSTYATSNPVTDIRAQIVHMGKLGINMKDAKLVVGAEAYLKLVDHPKFIERFEQVQAAILNEKLIAQVLGIREVLVPMSVENTAAEGAAATMAYIHGKHALLVHAPSAPGIDVPSGGYTFVWTGLVGAQNEGLRVKEWYRPEKSSTQIQGESAWDHKLVSAVCGTFFKDCVA